MINVEKRIEEMIKKKQFFKIKKGSEVMVIKEKDQLIHPSWLKGIHQCEECKCEDSYNFRHMNSSFQQVVKESDVTIINSISGEDNIEYIDQKKKSKGYNVINGKRVKKTKTLYPSVGGRPKKKVN